MGTITQSLDNAKSFSDRYPTSIYVMGNIALVCMSYTGYRVVKGLVKTVKR